MRRFIFVGSGVITLTVNPPGYDRICELQRVPIYAYSNSAGPFLWTQLLGTPITIENPTSLSPALLFPASYDNPLGYVRVRLTYTPKPIYYVDVDVNTSIFSLLPTSGVLTPLMDGSTTLVPSQVRAWFPPPSGAEGGYSIGSSSSTVTVNWSAPSYTGATWTRTDLLINMDGTYTQYGSLLSTVAPQSLTIPKGYNIKLRTYFVDGYGNTQVKVSDTLRPSTGSQLVIAEEVLNTANPILVSSSITAIPYPFNSPRTAYTYPDGDWPPSNIQYNDSTLILIPYQFNSVRSTQLTESYVPPNSFYLPPSSRTSNQYQFSAGGIYVG